MQKQSETLEKLFEKLFVKHFVAMRREGLEPDVPSLMKRIMNDRAYDVRLSAAMPPCDRTR